MKRGCPFPSLFPALRGRLGDDQATCLCCRVKLMYNHVNGANGQASPLVSKAFYEFVVEVSTWPGQLTRARQATDARFESERVPTEFREAGQLHHL